MRHILFVGVVASLVVGLAAQAVPPTAGGSIVGTGAFTVFVENMDRSLAFYHDVFGMDVPAIPPSGARPYNPANPRLFAMFDIPGARERHQSGRVAGTRVAVEVMEIQDVEHKTIDLRPQDPGTVTLVLRVRDLDATFARLLQAGARTATPGGKPVTLADGSRAVLVRDLDNRVLEIAQPASVPADAHDVVDMSLSIAVADLTKTAHIYRDVLGFDVKADASFAADNGLRALTGYSKAEVRRAHAHANGSMLDLEFVEYRRVERRPLTMKIQDRGATRLQLRAQNIDAMVDAVKTAGLRVLSNGAIAVPIPPNFKGALVADPDNFFLTLFEPCDGCARFEANRTPRD
jgi:catechol 2,3-dioxygenase-like lactoylglutathione lyase family enzyme